MVSPIANIVGTTEGIKTCKEAKKLCQDQARVCYSEKSMEEIKKEEYKPEFIEFLIKNGHHSPFDHFNITFSLENFPKAFAMTLNNLRPYTTGEKSARYTEMKLIEPKQKELYDKWIERFKDKISEKYPESNFPKLYDSSRKTTPIEKLAQENARYLTSVFTPTKMVHTISLRQLNIICGYFEDFIEENKNTSDLFKKKLIEPYEIFLNSEAVKEFRIENMKGKANSKLNLFGEPIEEIFSKDIYATNYNVSFACLAQLHRHRTLDYHINEGYDQRANLGFFIPPIIKGTELENEWVKDMTYVSNYDFPQGQLINVAEMGRAEDFYMKTRERICSNAQLEIVLATKDLIEKYSKFHPEYLDWIKPDCEINGCKKGGCILGGDNCLTRLI